MTTIKQLQKRLDRLARPDPSPDLVELAIAALSDSDLNLLHEHALLREAGIGEKAIAESMGRDRYEEALLAQERYLQHLWAFEEQAGHEYANRVERERLN